MDNVPSDNPGTVSLPADNQGTSIEGEYTKAIESSPSKIVPEVSSPSAIVPEFPHPSKIPINPNSPNLAKICSDTIDSIERTPPRIGPQTRLQRNAIQRRDYQELNSGRPHPRAQMAVTESEGVDRDSSCHLQDIVIIAPARLSTSHFAIQSKMTKNRFLRYFRLQIKI